jgi:hypothetical protein
MWKLVYYTFPVLFISVLTACGYKGKGRSRKKAIAK